MQTGCGPGRSGRPVLAVGRGGAASNLAVVTADPLAPLSGLPGVADGVDAARTAVDRLLNNRVVRRRSADVSAESSLRGAWAAAQLSGADVALEDVRSGAAAADPLVQGALRAYAAVPQLADTWTHAPRQALARLHVLAARGLVGDEALGRPRPDPQVAARLDGLADLLAEPSGAPALVVSAVVHGELLTVQPFGAATGVVARAASRLVLVSRGLDPKAVVAPEVGHLELREAYAMAADGYRTGEPEQVGRWIRHCAAAVELGAREGIAVCEALQRG